MSAIKGKYDSFKASFEKNPKNNKFEFIVPFLMII